MKWFVATEVIGVASQPGFAKGIQKHRRDLHEGAADCECLCFTCGESFFCHEDTKAQRFSPAVKKFATDYTDLHGWGYWL
jgi:hypothetical protein